MIDLNSPDAHSEFTTSRCQTVLMSARYWTTTSVLLPAAIVFLVMFSGVAGTRWIRDQNAINVVSRLSELQREELKENFLYFQRLDRTTQQQLRDLHEFVQQEETYQATVDAYQRWLESLSPFDRDALREKSEAADKIVLARDLINDETERKLKSPLERMREKGPVMTEDDIKRLVEGLKPKLPSQQQAAIAKLSFAKGAIDTIAAYITSESTSLAQFRDSLRRKENYDQIVSVIKDPILKDQLEQTSEPERVSEFGKALVRGLVAFRFKELYEGSNISNEFLIMEFSKLSPREMTEFFEQSAEYQKIRLRMMYLMQNTRWEETPFGDKNLETIASAFGFNFREYFFRRNGNNGPPFRGPGGPGGPERGPGGPDRDGRGGGFFNRRDERPDEPPGPPPPPPEQEDARDGFLRLRDRFLKQGKLTFVASFALFQFLSVDFLSGLRWQSIGTFLVEATK